MLLDGGETKNVGDVAPTEDPNTGPSGRQHQSLGDRSVQNSPATLPLVEGSNLGFYPRDLEGRAMQAMHKFSRNIAGSITPSWLPRRPQQGLPHEEFRPRELSSFWRSALRSWRPWVAALSIDLAGMFLVSSSTSVPQRSLGSTTGVAPNTRQDALIPLSTNEALELKRRKLRWAFYVLRNPFFDRFMRRPLEAEEKRLSPVPLVRNWACLQGRRMTYFLASTRSIRTLQRLELPF